MITVPTGELVGLLADTIPFACPDPELPGVNSVRLEWDRHMLHALSTDRIRIGIASWHPDDEPEGEVQDDLFTKFGGADEPWAVLIPLEDAKHIVKVFKLGPKEQRTPLTVDAHNASVTVKRSRDTGYPEMTVRVEGRLDEFPDLRAVLADADTVQPVTGLAYGAKFLADFAKVRPRSPLELTFTGATSPTLVQVGQRFTGAIMPTRVGDERERQAE